MAKILQSKENPQKTPRWLNWRLYTLVGLGVVVVLAVVGWLIYNHSSKATTTYENYSLMTQQSGSGMSFDKPAQDSDVLYSKTGQIELADVSSSSKVNSLIFAAVSPTSKLAYSSTELNSLATILSNIHNSLYLQYSRPINEFVSARLPTGTSATYTPFAEFTNPDIHANAWQTSFIAIESKNSNAQLKGKLIYAITNHGYYYFMFDTPAASWTSSQTTWTHVLDSLRIDQ